MKNSQIVCLAIFFSALAIALEAGSAPAANFVLFYSGRNDNQEIYILHPGNSEPLNLTRHPARDLCPAASPDGGKIAFLSDRGGNMDIYTMAMNGSNNRQLTSTPENEEHPEFGPDGKHIIFVRDFEQRTEIWIMDADGAKTPAADQQFGPRRECHVTPTAAPLFSRAYATAISRSTRRTAAAAIPCA